MRTKQMREERKALVLQAQALIPAVGQKWTDENRAKYDGMMADANLQMQDIERIELSERAAAEFGTVAPPNGQPGGADDEATAKARNEALKRAHNKYLRFGQAALSAEDRQHIRFTGHADLSAFLSEKEMRDMATSGQGAYPGIMSGGGIFVPVGFVNKIEEALKYYGPMLDGGADMPTIMVTASGQPLPFPTDNDTAQTGEQIDENAQVNAQDVTIGMVMLGAYKFSTKLVKVSIELLQDSAFDIESYLIRKFAERTGRILNSKFTTGAGTTTPMGIVTASTLGGTAIGSAGNSGGSEGANTIGSDDLVTLEHSVDPLYRNNARYMMHDSTLASLKKIKDKFGRPLWQPSVTVGEPDRINGYRYAINNDMAELQSGVGSPPATNKVLLFGQFNKYLIRRVKDMTVLRLSERYADYGQVAFLGFSRYDANMIDAGTHPVKYLKTVY